MRCDRRHGAAALAAALLLALDRDGSLSLLLCAALLHELGHLLCIRLTGGSLRGASFTAAGAELRYAGADGCARGLLIALGGPLFNLLAALAAGRLGLRLFAGLNLGLCLFNLLPVYPLDGGRALALLLEQMLGPNRGAGCYRAVSVTAALLCAAAALISCLRTHALWSLWVFCYLLWKQRELLRA